MAAAMTGCRFWYKPVPVANAIGEEETVLAGDSVNVHRGERFEVYGPNSEAVYDGYEQLNRAYRAFDRYFGQTSAKLAFVLAADSAVALDSATIRSFRDRGFKVVQYARPRGSRTRARYGGMDYGGILWPIAPTAARQLLIEFARDGLGSGERSDSGALDSFPLWYRAAVIRVVGDASSPTRDLQTIRERRHALIPLRDMLPFVRAPSADSLIDPSRANDIDEYTKTLVAQAGMLARYLVEQEGADVLNKLGRGYLARRKLAETMSAFRAAPRTIPELDARWKIWIDTREQ